MSCSSLAAERRRRLASERFPTDPKRRRFFFTALQLRRPRRFVAILDNKKEGPPKGNVRFEQSEQNEGTAVYHSPEIQKVRKGTFQGRYREKLRVQYMINENSRERDEICFF